MKRVKLKLSIKNMERLQNLTQSLAEEPKHNLHGEVNQSYVVREKLYRSLSSDVLPAAANYEMTTSCMIPKWLLARVCEHHEQSGCSPTELVSRIVNARLESE